MAIYEYICGDCGERFEVFRAMKDADQPIRCKACLSNNTHRALSRISSPRRDGHDHGHGGCSGCSGNCSNCSH